MTRGAATLPLDGRRALVTGGNSGIGAAVAAAFAEAGADLVVHHLDDTDGAQAVADMARDAGRRADIVTGDLAEPAAGSRIAEEVLRGGDVDILVLNASVEHRMAWEALSPGAIDLHVSANLTASLALLQALVPPMAARGWGRVISMGSIMAARPRAETLIYAALKAALDVALRSVSREVAGQGVTVNTIAPGAIETDRNAGRLRDPAVLPGVLAKIPAGRVGRPEDIAGPALMLASDAGSYITGATIPVDGGWSTGDAVRGGQ